MFANKDEYVIAKRIKEYNETYEEAVDFFSNNCRYFGYNFIFQLPSKERVQEVVDNFDKVNVSGDRPNQLFGIYGIYINERLVYIGKTKNDFSKRFGNYKSEMKKVNKSSRKIINILRKANKEGKKIEFRSIISSKNLPLSENDLKEYERMLIDRYKPEGNVF